MVPVPIEFYVIEISRNWKKIAGPLVFELSEAHYITI